jgi:uncharacterized protein (DUF1499 family)
MAGQSKGKQKIVAVGVALLIGLVVAAVVYVPSAGWTTNDVQTGKHPGYPDIVPHQYDMTIAHTTQFAAEAARRLGWEVKRTDPQAGEVEAVVTVFPIPFKDDVTVKVVESSGGKHSEVHIHSRSRVGSGDLGENARHIRALQAAMDAKLPRVEDKDSPTSKPK